MPTDVGGVTESWRRQLARRKGARSPVGVVALAGVAVATFSNRASPSRPRYLDMRFSSLNKRHSSRDISFLHELLLNTGG